MTKVIERTSSMLDTPPQDKLCRCLQVFNACEHFCIMMIMWGWGVGVGVGGVGGGGVGVGVGGVGGWWGGGGGGGGVGGGGGGAVHEGPDAGIWPYANRMGKHAYQAQFDGKIYKWKHTC